MFHLHLRDAVAASRCAALLAQAQALGFEPAQVNFHGQQRTMTDVRNNSRLLWPCPAIAAEITRAVMDAAGESFPHRFADMNFDSAADLLRVYRYKPGEYFKLHRDGKFRDGGRITRVTVLLYLNDTIGGETVLLPSGAGEWGDAIMIQPRTGDVLLFQHEMLHEGRPVLAGAKYVLRTDFFYRINPHELLAAEPEA